MKNMGVEWKWAVCHKELLHYKRACPWKEETKSYGRFSFQARVCCQNYWRVEMNEKHNEWKLSHLLSLTVCKLSVNRRLTDASVNDVFFHFCLPLLLYLVLPHCNRLSSPLPKKWESYGERGGFFFFKKRVRYRISVYCYTADASIDWLMGLFAWSDHACVWLHMHVLNRMYLHKFV